MLYALDVDYRDDGTARAALVGFGAWDDARAAHESVVRVAETAAYEPGAFYRRELPCLLAALRDAPSPPAVLVVDGHAWLRALDDPGLGARLWEALGRAAPVVGVAKQAFQSGVAVPVRRGGSENPLWVTAAGMDARDACERVAIMHGAHRLPTLLKRVDRACRDAP
jgi:deoxyribonuclease V